MSDLTAPCSKTRAAAFGPEAAPALSARRLGKSGMGSSTVIQRHVVAGVPISSPARYGRNILTSHGLLCAGRHN